LTHHQNCSYFFVVFTFRSLVQLNTNKFTRIFNSLHIGDRCKSVHFGVVTCPKFVRIHQRFSVSQERIYFIIALPEAKGKVAKTCKLRQDFVHLTLYHYNTYDSHIMEYTLSLFNSYGCNTNRNTLSLFNSYPCNTNRNTLSLFDSYGCNTNRNTLSLFDSYPCNTNRNTLSLFNSYPCNTNRNTLSLFNSYDCNTNRNTLSLFD
jgi:hypothetical protein